MPRKRFTVEQIISKLRSSLPCFAGGEQLWKMLCLGIDFSGGTPEKIP